jgi:hypothetical protein
MKIFCHICNKETEYTRYCGFSTYHLTKFHNIDPKEYYDKFIKKENEGKCKSCSNQTKYLSVTMGYSIYCSAKCRANDPEWKEKWFHTRGLTSKIQKAKRDAKNKRLQNSKRVCNICSIKCISYSALSAHLMQSHNGTTIKDYYDRYLKKADEGICNVCKKESEFGNVIIGYKKWCSRTCWSNDIERKLIHGAKLSKVLKGRPYSEKARITNEKTGRWKKRSDTEEFNAYHLLVWRETKKWILKLYRQWDGLDFYTKQKLITNKEYRKLNPGFEPNKNLLQPSIDHKQSIRYGFDNNINPFEIGRLENLCICSKSVNSSKSNMTEQEFMERIKEITNGIETREDEE